MMIIIPMKKAEKAVRIHTRQTPGYMRSKRGDWCYRRTRIVKYQNCRTPMVM